MDGAVAPHRLVDVVVDVHCWVGVEVGASRLVDRDEVGLSTQHCRGGALTRCCQGRGVKVGVSRWGHQGWSTGGDDVGVVDVGALTWGVDVAVVNVGH